MKSIDGPVVLVGHSYGGSVISEAAEGLPNVKGLGLCRGLRARHRRDRARPDRQVPRQHARHGARAAGAAAGRRQRPLYLQARSTISSPRMCPPPKRGSWQRAASGSRGGAVRGVDGARWKTIPSWFIYGDGDKNIPPVAMGSWPSAQRHGRPSWSRAHRTSSWSRTRPKWRTSSRPPPAPGEPTTRSGAVRRSPYRLMGSVSLHSAPVAEWLATIRPPEGRQKPGHRLPKQFSPPQPPTASVGIKHILTPFFFLYIYIYIYI